MRYTAQNSLGLGVNFKFWGNNHAIGGHLAVILQPYGFNAGRMAVLLAVWLYGFNAGCMAVMLAVYGCNDGRTYGCNAGRMADMLALWS